MAVGFLLVYPHVSFVAAPRTFPVTIQRVSDGDAITAISDNATGLRIRLLCIDTPENFHGSKPGQPSGRKAQDNLDAWSGEDRPGRRLRAGPLHAHPDGGVRR